MSKASKFINRIGIRYGNLVALKYLGKKRWLCKCDCGNEKDIASCHLVGGNTKSCGCLRTGRRIIDHKNKRYGKLVVIEYVGSNRHGAAKWLCKCDCGKIKIKSHTYFCNKRNITKSCGCVAQDESRKRNCLPPGMADFNWHYARYIEGSVKRELEFSLSKEQFKQITSSDCYYCGSKPINYASRTRYKRVDTLYIHNGIDRKDNSKGYTIDNSVPCCWPCNDMKCKRSETEYIDHCSKVYNHTNSRKTEAFLPL